MGKKAKRLERPERRVVDGRQDGPNVEESTGRAKSIKALLNPALCCLLAVSLKFVGPDNTYLLLCCILFIMGPIKALKAPPPYRFALIFASWSAIMGYLRYYGPLSAGGIRECELGAVQPFLEMALEEKQCTFSPLLVLGKGEPWGVGRLSCLQTMQCPLSPKPPSWCYPQSSLFFATPDWQDRQMINVTFDRKYPKKIFFTADRWQNQEGMMFFQTIGSERGRLNTIGDKLPGYCEDAGAGVLNPDDLERPSSAAR